MKMKLKIYPNGKGWVWKLSSDRGEILSSDSTTTPTAAIIDALQKFPPKPGDYVDVKISED